MQNIDQPVDLMLTSDTMQKDVNPNENQVIHLLECYAYSLRGRSHYARICAYPCVSIVAVLNENNEDVQTRKTGFPLHSGSEIQGLSRTLKLHFQGPIIDISLQHVQYYSNI